MRGWLGAGFQFDADMVKLRGYEFLDGLEMVNLMVGDGEILKIYFVRGTVGSCGVPLSTNTVIHKKR